mmetsp:Transcript_32224/g.51676  ORF Transcript_32224/g.51676 Transcript_32224/m.51676 type:complete len:239 (-) Transcript_32224:166-882(-)|eukprot:CAMPEP_0197023726 /NCGR_PEP_ID=MMETSP1384-20130603/4381_1 /TAXON_ID=29189 /ORGANISM="Ammonia sp." /LENGTH=238 /DNA_ID=CAMNT_0042451987 /DNA_START=39 /DNA_END=755 /DNA_ORIENTATION=-
MTTEQSTSPDSSTSPSSQDQPGQDDGDSSSKLSNLNTRRFSQSNGFYSPEGDKPNAYLSNTQLFANTSTDSLFNQLKTHTELALRASTEAFDRRKEELTTLRQQFAKRLEEQRCLYEKQLSKQNEAHQTEYNRLKHDTESKIKSLEIQLAERVAAQNAMEKSNKEKFDTLNVQITEKTQRVNKLEADYEEIQKKYADLQKEKQELQHEHDNLNEQVQRIKSMMLGVGSNKKRRINEML